MSGDKKLVALSIVLMNGTAAGGVRNDAYRGTVHAASMEDHVKCGRVIMEKDSKRYYYGITVKGRDYYEKVTGNIVDDMIFEEDCICEE